jgi:hypothetical protein
MGCDTMKETRPMKRNPKSIFVIDGRAGSRSFVLWFKSTLAAALGHLVLFVPGVAEDRLKRMMKDTRMLDAELIEVASEFRRGMIGDRSSEGCCFMVSAPLASLLRGVYGVPCDLVESDRTDMDTACYEHVWIRLADGRVLDPTFDQFCSEDRVPVYLGAPTEFHQA